MKCQYRKVQYVICILVLHLIIGSILGQETTLNSHFRLEKENISVKNGSDTPSEEFIVEGSKIECWLKCQLHYLRCFTLEILRLNISKWLCRFYDVDYERLEYEATDGSQIYSTPPRSCLEWLEKGFPLDGVYKILTVGEEKEVYCDMTGIYRILRLKPRTWKGRAARTKE